MEHLDTMLAETPHKDLIFREFFNKLALVEAERELHVSRYDMPIGMTEDRTIPVEAAPTRQTSKLQKFNMMLTFNLPLMHEGLYLMASEDDSAHWPTGFYQDEWSNIEGNAPLPGGPCKCDICRIRVRRMEDWTTVDFKIAEAAIDFMKRHLENPRLLKDDYKILIEKGVTKSMKKVMDLVKSLKEKGYKNEQIKDLVRKCIDFNKKNVSECIFKNKEGFQLWRINEGIDKPVEDFLKSKEADKKDVLDFTKDLIKGLSPKGKELLKVK